MLMRRPQKTPCEQVRFEEVSTIVDNFPYSWHWTC